MAATKYLRTIVWAVDAFEGTFASQRNAIETVRYLQESTQASIHPVYVLSSAELNLTPEFAAPGLSEYRPAAEKSLLRFLSETGLQSIRKPTVLLQNSTSISRSTDLLVKYCIELGADLTLVSTHGRSGVRRLLLGSFAETLLLRSSIPVMAVGPRMMRPCKLRHILMPTEFGEGAKGVFRQIVRLAKDLDARITLFHAMPRPVEPMFQSGLYLMGTPWVPVHEGYSRELARYERRAAGWVRWALNQGVQTDMVIDKETDDIAAAIVGLAKKNEIGCIAMAAHHGPIASALLGSVTRQVMRMSDCPVWVLRRLKPASSMGLRSAKAA